MSRKKPISLKDKELSRVGSTRTSFLLLMSAEAISACGTQITLVALPLTAVTLLHSTPLDLGFIQAASALPPVIFGLFAGIFVESLQKRKVLIYANGICSVVMAIIPISAYFDSISIGVLVAASFIGNTASVAEKISLSALVPETVDSSELAEANGKFGSVMAMMSMIGPAAAGALTSLISPAYTIAVDAISFLVASVLSFLLPASSTNQETTELHQTVSEKMFDGVRELAKYDVLVDMFLVGSTANFVGASFNGLDALFLVRQLKVTPSGYGVALAICGVGAIIGSTLSGRFSKRFDLSTLFNCAVVLVLAGFMGISLLRGNPAVVFILFCFCYFVFGFGGALVNTALITYVQSIVPRNSLSRVIGVLTSGFSILIPLGALSGGALAEVIGIRFTLVAGVIMLTSVFLFSVLRKYYSRRPF